MFSVNYYLMSSAVRERWQLQPKFSGYQFGQSEKSVALDPKVLCLRLWTINVSLIKSLNLSGRSQSLHPYNGISNIIIVKSTQCSPLTNAYSPGEWTCQSTILKLYPRFFPISAPFSLSALSKSWWGESQQGSGFKEINLKHYSQGREWKTGKNYTTREILVKVTGLLKDWDFIGRLYSNFPLPHFTTTSAELQFNNSGLQLKEQKDTDPFWGEVCGEIQRQQRQKQGQ